MKIEQKLNVVIELNRGNFMNDVLKSQKKTKQNNNSKSSNKANIKVGFIDQIVLTLCNLIMKYNRNEGKYVSLMTLDTFSAEYYSECHGHHFIYNIIDTILRIFQHTLCYKQFRFFLNLMLIVQLNDCFGRYYKVFIGSIKCWINYQIVKTGQSQSLRVVQWNILVRSVNMLLMYDFYKMHTKLMKVLLPLRAELERNDDNRTILSLNSIVNFKPSAGMKRNQKFNDNEKWFYLFLLFLYDILF